MTCIGDRNIYRKRITQANLLSPLERTQERMLLRLGLERAVSKLGARVDKFELDFFQIPTAGVDHQALADRDHALLGARDRALEHEEVVLDDTVVRESTQWRDRLVRRVRVGARVVRVLARSDAVDFLVEFGTVVVSIYTPVNLTSTSNHVQLTLTGASDREHDLARMPRSDTSDLAQSLVGLAGQLLGSPASSHALESVTLGNSDHIDDLVLLEYARHLDGLFEQTVRKGDLVRNRSTVDLL